LTSAVLKALSSGLVLPPQRFSDSIAALARAVLVIFRCLVDTCIDRYAQKAGKRIRNIDKKTMELFPRYDWPGNIRELQNVVERAVILCEGRLSL